MANILIKQGREIAGSSLVTPSSKADKTDLSSIIQTGTTSSQAISAGTYFYLNDVLVRAKVDIANGATFTLNTNYEVVTAGALNDIISDTELYNAVFTTVGAFASLSGMTVSALSEYKSVEVKLYWANTSTISLFLDVANNAFTQGWVTPQVVEAGTTYRFLVEAKFENNQLYVRANITGYTFTPSRVKVYPHLR